MIELMNPRGSDGRINKRLIYPLVVGVIALVAYFVASLFYATNPSLNQPPQTSIVVIPKGSSQPGQTSLVPQNISVVVGVNSTVQWVNKDVVPVSIESDSNYVDPVGGNFSSIAQMPSGGDILPGKTFNFTFTQPGSYGYHGIPHPWVRGTVIVSQP